MPVNFKIARCMSKDRHTDPQCVGDVFIRTKSTSVVSKFDSRVVNDGIPWKSILVNFTVFIVLRNNALDSIPFSCRAERLLNQEL